MDDHEADSPAARLRLLLGLEIRRIVVGLESRRELLASLWGRSRAREPMLQTIHSRWAGVQMHHLLILEPEEIVALEAFYGLLDEVRIYVSFTDDMPTTMLDEMDSYREQLRELGEEAVRCLGDEVVLMRQPE